MFSAKVTALLLSLKFLICPCGWDRRQADFERNQGFVKVQRFGKMQQGRFTESSGLAKSQTESTFFSHSDSGAPPYLYRLNFKGQVTDTIRVPGAVAMDWEAMTTDGQGNLYIADFGNNYNNRKDLAIYKWPEPPATTNNAVLPPAQKINISYKPQKAFPPTNEQDWQYNAEALFYWQDSLYIINKNGQGKTAALYSLPANPSTNTLVLSPQTNIKLKGIVTGASMNATGTMLAVATYGRIYFFKNHGVKGMPLYLKPYKCIAFAKGQVEAITWINPKQLLVSNETARLWMLTLKGNI